MAGGLLFVWGALYNGAVYHYNFILWTKHNNAPKKYKATGRALIAVARLQSFLSVLTQTAPYHVLIAGKNADKRRLGPKRWYKVIGLVRIAVILLPNFPLTLLLAKR